MLLRAKVFFKALKNSTGDAEYLMAFTRTALQVSYSEIADASRSALLPVSAAIVSSDDLPCRESLVSTAI
ncbi:MAG: hypothetical protein H0X73_09745 [Chthoniobacterales bacterium]|nr:hypothetical protein [Chthoniobacterales bacterium]